MALNTPPPEVWTIVVAAGSGTRFGAPKQFLDLAGQRVVDRSIETAARHSHGVVVVLPADLTNELPMPATTGSVEPRTVTGDISRAGSVRRGLAAVPASADILLIHDGARPLATDLIFESVIQAVVNGADAVAPVVPVTDTIRRRGDGVVDRSELVAVQTPQGFPAQVLRDAHASGAEATDDTTLVEAAGGTVVLVHGDRRNLKITTPLDMDIACALIERDADD